MHPAAGFHDKARAQEAYADHYVGDDAHGPVRALQRPCRGVQKVWDDQAGHRENCRATGDQHRSADASFLVDDLALPAQKRPENDGQKEDAGMEIFPELGATAAGQLLDRHEQRTESFDLQAVSTSELRNAGCPAYRFRTPTARQQVIRWWEAQKNAKVPTEKAP